MPEIYCDMLMICHANHSARGLGDTMSLSIINTTIIIEEKQESKQVNAYLNNVHTNFFYYIFSLFFSLSFNRAATSFSVNLAFLNTLYHSQNC